MGRTVRALTAALALASAAQAAAAAKPLDLRAVIADLMQVSSKPKETTLLMWLPAEFWAASARMDPTVGEADIQKLRSAFEPYIPILVVHGHDTGLMGRTEFKSEAEIRTLLRLQDAEGNTYQPLADDAIQDDTKTVLSLFGPMLSGMVGQLGQNMHVYFFPARGKAGQLIAPVKQKGSFSVLVGERRFRWRLPLGAFLPPKTCPRCKEETSGAYTYCPWCGAQLPPLEE